MVLATTVQQSVAYVIVLIAVVAVAVWAFAQSRRARPEIGSEVELAPNRKPYYSDDEMEGKRLDSFGAWALAAITIIAVGLPLYWLAEPGRQKGAIKQFAREAAGTAFRNGTPVGGGALSLPTAQRGFNCQGCHGGVSGGQVPYTLTDPVTKKVSQVIWTAPSLDDVTLRMTDDQLREILTYGRPFSPMPAWGIAGGGPMNDQQIENLIAWLHSVAIKPEAAKRRNEQRAAEELKILQDPQSALAKAQADAAAATTSDERLKAQTEVARLSSIIRYKEPATMGAALFNLNCARCHTLGYSYGQAQAPGGGAFGPSLDNVINQFVVAQDQIDFVTNGKKFGEKYGAQGKASGRMPYFLNVLSDADITAIVDFERQLSQQRQGAK